MSTSDGSTKVYVTITGPTQSGKSWILYTIAEALKPLSVTIESEDLEKETRLGSFSQEPRNWEREMLSRTTAVLKEINDNSQMPPYVILAAYALLQEVYQAWKRAMSERGHPDGDRDSAHEFEEQILPRIRNMMGEPAPAIERQVIKKGTVFLYRYLGKGEPSTLEALEDITVLRKGEIAAPFSYKVRIVESSGGTPGEICDISVWEHEYSLLNNEVESTSNTSELTPD